MFWNWLALVCLLLDSCSPNSAYRQKDGSSAAVEFIGTITVNNSDATLNQTEAKEDAMLDDLLNSQMAVINQSMPPPVKRLSADDPLATNASWSLKLSHREGMISFFHLVQGNVEEDNVESNENPIVTGATSILSAMRGKQKSGKIVTVSVPENRRDICAMLLHPMSLSGAIQGMDAVMSTLGQAAIKKRMPFLFFLRETIADAVTEYKQVLSAARHSLGCNSFVLMGFSTGAAVAAAMLGEFWKTSMQRTSETIKGFVGVSPPVSNFAAFVGKYGWYKMTAMIDVSVPKYLIWGGDDDWGPTSEAEAQQYRVKDTRVVRGENHFWEKKASLKSLERQVMKWLEDILKKT